MDAESYPNILVITFLNVDWLSEKSENYMSELGNIGTLKFSPSTCKVQRKYSFFIFVMALIFLTSILPSRVVVDKEQVLDGLNLQVNIHLLREFSFS